jgi:hypothetical protein
MIFNILIHISYLCVKEFSSVLEIPGIFIIIIIFLFRISVLAYCRHCCQALNKENYYYYY